MCNVWRLFHKCLWVYSTVLQEKQKECYINVTYTMYWHVFFFVKNQKKRRYYRIQWPVKYIVGSGKNILRRSADTSLKNTTLTPPREIKENHVCDIEAVIWVCLLHKVLHHDWLQCFQIDIREVNTWFTVYEVHACKLLKLCKRCIPVYCKNIQYAYANILWIRKYSRNYLNKKYKIINISKIW